MEKKPTPAHRPALTCRGGQCVSVGCAAFNGQGVTGGKHGSGGVRVNLGCGPDGVLALCSVRQRQVVKRHFAAAQRHQAIRQSKLDLFAAVDDLVDRSSRGPGIYRKSLAFVGWQAEVVGFELVHAGMIPKGIAKNNTHRAFT